MEQILREVIAAQREFSVCDDVSVTPEFFNNARGFQAYLLVIDQRRCKILPLELRGASIDLSNILGRFLNLCPDSFPAFLGDRPGRSFQNGGLRQCIVGSPCIQLAYAHTPRQ